MCRSGDDEVGVSRRVLPPAVRGEPVAIRNGPGVFARRKVYPIVDVVRDVVVKPCGEETDGAQVDAVIVVAARRAEVWCP